MQRERNSRRSFLLGGVAAVSGSLLLGGCGDAAKPTADAKQDDPTVKAKESMDYYKNNMMKKAAKK